MNSLRWTDLMDLCMKCGVFGVWVCVKRRQYIHVGHHKHVTHMTFIVIVFISISPIFVHRKVNSSHHITTVLRFYRMWNLQCAQTEICMAAPNNSDSKYYFIVDLRMRLYASAYSNTNRKSLGWLITVSNCFSAPALVCVCAEWMLAA